MKQTWKIWKTKEERSRTEKRNGAKKIQGEKKGEKQDKHMWTQNTNTLLIARHTWFCNWLHAMHNEMGSE